jgi:hypothetical protein
MQVYVKKKKGLRQLGEEGKGRKGKEGEGRGRRGRRGRKGRKGKAGGEGGDERERSERRGERRGERGGSEVGWGGEEGGNREAVIVIEGVTDLQVGRLAFELSGARAKVHRKPSRMIAGRSLMSRPPMEGAAWGK